MQRQSLVSKDKGRGAGWEKNNVISLKHNVQASRGFDCHHPRS